MKLNLYEIRFCRKDEYDKLIDFIRCHWIKDHIFCQSKEMFEFQHGNASDGYYDFVVAVHKETEEIHAILGFIRSSTYDGCTDEPPQAIYGAVWKVRDDIQNKEIGKLGLGVLYYLIRSFPDSTYITLGLSPYGQTVYNAIHFNFGKTKQYYIASPYVDHFCIAKNPKTEMAKSNARVFIKKLTEAENISNDFYPDKNATYIRKRYLEHPVYSYELLGVYVDNELICEWVVRTIKREESTCLRLVDMVGSLDGLNDIRGNVIDLLRQYKAEYIDCYNYGIEPEIFKRIGFFEVDDEVIIPNYFEPFERKNIDLHYACDGKKPVVIFKADGDQDRPRYVCK